MDPLGDYLKQARKKKRLSLEKLAAQTKIQEHHLLALESEDFANLPAKVFAKGFVRSYAKAVGLDEDEALQCFLETSGTFYDQHQPDQDQTHVQVTLEAPPRQGVNWNLVFGILVVIVALAIWYGFPKKQDTENVLTEPETSRQNDPIEEQSFPILDPEVELQENVPPIKAVESVSEQSAPPIQEVVPTQPSSTPIAPPIAESLSPVPTVPAKPLAPTMTTEPVTPSEEISVAVETQVLEIEATQLTWVVVKADQQDPSEALLQPGQRNTWKAEKQFLLTLGNAAGVLIRLNGEPQGPFGKPGQVVREIRLQP